MKKIITFWMIVFMAGTASAGVSKVGTSGAQFLKIGVGSRYQGMGEASVAMANDVYAAYWNPAGLTEIENWSVGFTNVNWFLDVDLNYFGMAHYVENIGAFGLSATVLSMDEQEITTLEQQDGTGDTYSAASYQVGLSYARQVTAKFAFGVTAKYVGERIHREHASTFAFDFGTTMRPGWRTLRFAMSIANMGPSMKFSGPDLDVNYDQMGGEGANEAIGASVKTTSYELPMTFRVGAAYDINTGYNSILTLSGEIKHPNDLAQQASLGAELVFSEKFYLRSGYKLGYDEETIAFGAGLSTNITNGTSLIIDYAWQDFGRLDNTQKFSVGFSF
jgi:hypothetical protein